MTEINDPPVSTPPLDALGAIAPVRERVFDEHVLNDFEFFEAMSSSLFSGFDREVFEPLWHTSVRFIYFMSDLRRSETRTDWVSAAVRFLSHSYSPYDVGELSALFREGTADTSIEVLAGLVAESLAPEFVAADLPWVLRGARGVLNTVKDLPHSELFRKGYATLMGLFCFPLVKQLGLNFSFLGFEMFAEHHTKKFRFGSVAEMATSLVDLLLTMAEVGYACFAERSLQPLMRVNGESQKFVDRVNKIKSVVALRYIDESWDANDALAELVSLREAGYVLAKVSPDRVFILGLTSQIDKLLVDLSQRNGVSAYRRAPFSVMVYGTPGIGKSYVMNMLLSWYHQVVTNPCDRFPEGIYPDLLWDPKRNLWTKNFSDDYDSDYKGNIHWAVCLDDLAQEHVEHVKSGIVNSTMNLISLVNNVGYASTQAELELKGKIPKNPKFVIASTNTKHLNAYWAVQEPAAIARRLPIIVEPRLKPEFIANDSGVMRQCDTAQRDAWCYYVEEVKLHIGAEKKVFTKNIQIKGSVGTDNLMSPQELFPYLRRKIVEHELTQRSLQDALVPSDGDKMCPICICPRHYCACKGQVEAEACASIGAQAKFACFTLLLRTGLLSFLVWMYLTWTPSLKDSFFSALQYRFPVLSQEIFGRVIDSRVPEKVRNFSSSLRGTAAGVFVGALCGYAANHFFGQREDVPLGASGVWYSPSSSFSVPRNTMNDGGVSVVAALKKSMLSITISAFGDIPRVLCAVSLGDGNLMTTGHPFLPQFEEWAVTTRYSEKSSVEAVSTFKVNRSNLTFVEGTDLVIIRTCYAIPRRNLIPYLTDEFSSALGQIKILSRSPDGVFMEEEGKILSYREEMQYKHEGRMIPTSNVVFFSREKGNTTKGDCGSIILANSSRGWYVHSMICAGSVTGVGVAILLRKSLAESEPLFSPFDSDSYFAAGNASSGSLHELSSKNKFLWTDGGSAEVVGSFPGRTKPKSRVYPSKHSDELREVLPLETEYGAPVMGTVVRDETHLDPWTLNLSQLLKPNTHFGDSEVASVAKSFLDDLLSSRDWLADVRPVAQDVAINGERGNPFVNLLPMSTSGGFVQSGPKRNLFVREKEGDPYVPGEFLQERLDSLRECYREGSRACFMMSGHLKDEPVSQQKIDACKTRLFTGCAVDASIVMREQFIKISEAFMRNNLHSECMAGLNCYGKGWEDLFYHLTRGEEHCDTMIFGDFKAFDKQMSCVMVFYAFWILSELNRASGNFTEEDFLIQRGLATDICYPYVNFNGDVAMLFGSNSSGHPLTVIVNSIVNSMYMRLCYARIFPQESLSNFKRDVRLATLGDDNVMSSVRDEFNHTSVQKVLASLRIEYTMPDKKRLSVPFVSIFDYDFLKRKFVKFEQHVLAPIELESTFKSLMCIVRRGNISDAQQTAETYLSARREWALHGEQVFDTLVGKVDPILSGDEEIAACFISKHRLSWRQTFDWVMSGVLPEDLVPEDDFEACGRRLTRKERLAIHQAKERELALLEEKWARDADQARKIQAREKRSARRERARAISELDFEAMDGPVPEPTLGVQLEEVESRHSLAASALASSTRFLERIIDLLVRSWCWFVGTCVGQFLLSHATWMDINRYFFLSGLQYSWDNFAFYLREGVYLTALLNLFMIVWPLSIGIGYNLWTIVVTYAFVTWKRFAFIILLWWTFCVLFVLEWMWHLDPHGIFGQDPSRIKR